MIKVSIIVPIYNAKDYLSRCINSLLNQSLKDIEIILINDGSTDDSEDIINQYDDKRIVHINKANEGIGKTRNLGIELSKGEFLTFVDSDDFVDTDFCEKMYTKAINDNCDVVVCDYYDHIGNIYLKKEIVNFNDCKLSTNPILITLINLGPCNKIYKTNLIKDNHFLFPENLKYEDASFVCECLEKANLIGKLNDAICYFTIHENSQTTVRDDKIFDIFKVTDKVINTFSNDVYSKYLLNLVVQTITDYTVQTRYIKNNQVRNSFINSSYNYLKCYNRKWYKCDYISNLSLPIQIVLKNKLLLKLYCQLYKK